MFKEGNKSFFFVNKWHFFHFGILRSNSMEKSFYWLIKIIIANVNKCTLCNVMQNECKLFACTKIFNIWSTGKTSTFRWKLLILHGFRLEYADSNKYITKKNVIINLMRMLKIRMVVNWASFIALTNNIWFNFDFYSTRPCILRIWRSFLQYFLNLCLKFIYF